MKSEIDHHGDVRLINRTPHRVDLIGDDGRIVSIQPESAPIRLAVERTVVETLTIGSVPIPICRTTVVAGDGPPEPVEGSLFIVSRLVADAYPDRSDLVVPDRLVRDADGVVLGARGLSRR